MTTRCPPPEDVLRSLMPGEQDVAGVRDHVASCADCGQIASALREGVRRVRGEIGGPVSMDRGPDCLSEEVIAAFADGTLPPDERDRAVKHLADCARCSAELADLVRALGDPAVQAAQREGKSRGRWIAVGAVAAALALVVGRQLLIPRAAAWNVPELASRVAAGGIPSGWTDVAWPATRGTGTGSLSARSAAFRVGMRTLDLRVAISSGDTTRVRRWTGELTELLSAIPLADPARAAVTGVSAAIGGPADSLRAADLRFEAAARYAGDSAQATAGLWIEAARLAALSGQVDLLRSSTLRQVVKQLGTGGAASAPADSLAGALPSAQADQLATIRRLLDMIALAAGG